MVAVVGAPAEGEFGKVARADHHAAGLVGDVHQDLGPLAGLGVLVGGILDGGVVSDIRKMLIDRRDDGNFTPGDPERLHQVVGIGPGPFRGAKAGHGHPDDPLPAPAEPVEGEHRHEQGQRAVEAA